MLYYPFIDGLRAVAVLLVVLFHLDIAFPGGFIGVDIFFVISGFLITSLIIRDSDAGTFTMLGFWERRARRILPALLLVVIATAVVGWFLLLPRDLVELGWSVLAQMAFLQNVVFWSGEGYFAAPSETKPLLHTWSLAVEEQFYLMFPIFLVLLGPLARRIWLIIFVSLAMISFVVSVFAVRYFPGAAFYFLPSRAWELLLGSFIAVIPPPRFLHQCLREIATAIALIILLATATFYSADTPFPGWAALPPCAATATIIWMNQTGRTMMVRLLELPPLIFLGLISYSLYLWHWPLISYYKYWQIEPTPLGVKLLLLVVSIVLAVVSWRFVETPFRRSRYKWHPQKVLIYAAAGLLSCALIGSILVSNNGWAGRFPKDVILYDEVAREETYRNEMNLAALGDAKWTQLGTTAEKSETLDLLVWGDSLAMALCPALDDMCSETGLSGIAITRSATAPLLGFCSMSTYALGEDSPAFAAAVLALVNEKKPKNVILAAAWSSYAGGKTIKPGAPSHKGDFWQALTETIVALKKSGAKVWLVFEPPMHRHHVPALLARKRLFGVPLGSSLITPAEYDAATAPFRTCLADKVGDKVQLIELAGPMRETDASGQEAFRITDNFGIPLYRDHIHLSTYGARFVRPILEQALQSAATTH